MEYSDKKVLLKMYILVFIVIFLGNSACTAFPIQCQKDGFFDPLKQIYLPCTECTVERRAKCRECCPTLQQEPSDSINYDSEPQNTAAVPSVVYNTDKQQNQVLGLFFHILIIVIVVASMSTIVCVGFKVVKDRRTAHCCNNVNNNHCNNVSVIQEVLTPDGIAR